MSRTYSIFMSILSRLREGNILVIGDGFATLLYFEYIRETMDRLGYGDKIKQYNSFYNRIVSSEKKNLDLRFLVTQDYIDVLYRDGFDYEAVFYCFENQETKQHFEKLLEKHDQLAMDLRLSDILRN